MLLFHIFVYCFSTSSNDRLILYIIHKSTTVKIQCFERLGVPHPQIMNKNELYQFS